MKCYVIRDWDKHFETHESRKREGPLRWIAMPNRHDGKGYRRVVKRSDAERVFCGWSLIVEIASKMPRLIYGDQPTPRRGALADEDGPLTAADMADATGFGIDVFESALNALSDSSIGWIFTVDMPRRAAPPADSGIARHGAGLQDRTGQDITEQDKTPLTPQGGQGDVSNSSAKQNNHGQARAGRDSDCESALPGFERWWKSYPVNHRKVNKAGCRRKWLRKSSGADGRDEGGLEPIAEQVIAGMERLKKSRDWTKNGGEYVPAPMVFLNQRRWEVPADLAEQASSDNLGPQWIRRKHNADDLACMRAGGDE